jgi:hypothetical protein
MNSSHILWPIPHIPTLNILTMLHSSAIWRRYLYPSNCCTVVVNNWEIPTSIDEYLQQVTLKRNHSKIQCCPLVFEIIFMLHRWSAFNTKMFPWVGRDEVLKSDTLVKHGSRMWLCTQFYTLQHSSLLVWSHIFELFDNIKLHSSFCIVKYTPLPPLNWSHAQMK